MSQFEPCMLPMSPHLSRAKSFIKNLNVISKPTASQPTPFNLDIFKNLDQHELLHMSLARKTGEPGLSVIEMAEILKMIGAVSGGVATSLIGNTLGLSALLNFGGDALIKKVVDDCQRGFALWSFAMTEKNIGSDVKCIQTRADWTGNGYVLSGEKNYITNGSVSKYLSVFAQTYDQNGSCKGISCFLVQGDSPGLQRSEPLQKFSFQESDTAHLYFKNVFVDKDHRIGVEGEGLKILQKCISQSKTLFAAVGVGISERALQLTEHYLRETSRFGKPLIENNVIAHLLVRLHMETEAAWLLTKKAADTWDALKIAVTESSMAKLMSGLTASKVTGECMELFGATSVLFDSEINRLYRDAKGVEIIEGTSRIQELIIIQKMFKSQGKNTIAFKNGAA